MLDPLLVVEPGGQRCLECDKPVLSLLALASRAPGPSLAPRVMVPWL